jgi:hypothetical protein
MTAWGEGIGVGVKITGLDVLVGQGVGVGAKVEVTVGSGVTVADGAVGDDTVGDSLAKGVGVTNNEMTVGVGAGGGEAEKRLQLTHNKPSMIKQPNKMPKTIIKFRVVMPLSCKA